MAITATITKAELDNRTVASVVQSGITFNSFQASPFFMYIPETGTNTQLNTVEVTVSGIEFGVPSLPIKVYASKTNNWETIISQGKSYYELHSTTISGNGVFTYSVTLTSGQLPPSDVYYIFCVIDDGGSYHTVSAYQKVTISTYNLNSTCNYGILSGMQSGLVNSQLISESLLASVPKFLMLDITWNVDRNNTGTTALEVFNGTSSYTKCFLIYDQYAKTYECLSITNAKTLSGTQLSETYKDTNKIYLYYNGTSYPMTINYIEGFGLCVTCDINPTIPNQFMFQYLSITGHAFQAEMVQSVVNTSSISFNIDPNAIFIAGGCGPIDGANSKRSYSTNNYTSTFGTADRTTNQYRTACYANSSGVCKSYIDSNTSPIIAASPTSGTDNYTLALNSFSTNQINLTYTGSSDYNSYIIYAIALHFPKNGKFQNVSKTVSSISSADIIFSKHILSSYVYHNYSKNDGTCFFHDAFSGALIQAGKRVLTTIKKSNQYLYSTVNSFNGYFIQKTDLTQQYSYLASSGGLYHRSDNFLGSSSASVLFTISTSTLLIQSAGASLVLDYNFTGFAVLRDSNSSNPEYLGNIATSTSFSSTYSTTPALLIQHDSAFTCYGAFIAGSNQYRFYLSKTINMSTDDVLDITSLISSNSTTTYVFNAVNTLSGIEKFYNQSTCYIIAISGNIKDYMEPKPIIITTTSGNDYRTYTNSFTIAATRTLIFDEVANGFKFGAAIIGCVDSNTMPYENTNNGSNGHSTIYVSYNYHTKYLKVAYMSYYNDNSVCRTVCSTDFAQYSYDYLRHGLNNATSSSPFYSTDACDFQYIPGEGLYMCGKTTTISCTMLAFGGPSLLADTNFGLTTAPHPFIPSAQFMMNSTNSANSQNENIISAGTNFSYGVIVAATTPKTMCISTRVDTGASGTRAVTVSNAHISRQQLTTAYVTSYSSRTNSPSTYTYGYNYTGTGDSDTLITLSIFTGSLEPSLILNTTTWPAAGSSSTVDYSHALTSGAQAVLGLSVNQATTSSPVNNTAYTDGSFMMGWGSINKTGNRFGSIEQTKLYNGSTAYYTQRAQNTNYIKGFGQNSSYVSGNCYRSIDVTNFKKGAGPYNVEHSFATSSLSTGTVYGSLIEVAFPLGSGQLFAGSPVSLNYNFSEDMKFDFHRISTDITLSLSYSFGSMSIDYGPVIENPIALSYNIENNQLSYNNSIAISPISLSYDIQNIDIVRKIDITELSLSYSFGSMSLTSTIDLSITPITLSYNIQNNQFTYNNSIAISPISLTYNIENNQLSYNNTFTSSSITLVYSFENNSFNYANSIAISPISLSYTFGSISINNNQGITQDTPLLLSYNIENNQLSYNNAFNITSPITMLYGYELLVINYNNTLSVDNISLSYNFQNNIFNYSNTLQQLTQIYLSYSFENNQINYNNAFSISPISLTYSFENIDITNVSGYNITPITLDYNFENNSFNYANSIAISPISLTYNIENNQINYNNAFSISPITLSYDIQNNQLNYANSIAINPISLTYNFGSMSFGGNSILNHDTPISLSYNIEDNQFTYNNAFSITPISLTYSFQSYSLTNGITLNNNSPLTNYIIIENNQLNYNNTFSITPITLSYNIQNNQINYNNAFNVSPISLTYSFQSYLFVTNIILDITPITLSYNIQNDMLTQVAGNYIFPINPFSLDYSFGNMQMNYQDPLHYLFDDPIRNYIIFQNDMTLTTKPPTYLAQENPSPWQFSTYNFGSMSFAYGTPVNLLHNSPVLITYNFESSFGIHVSANYSVSPVSLSYNFQNGLNMKVDQIITIDPITLTYSFQNYVLKNDTNIDQLSPLVMSYNFGTINIINNKTFVINPITLKIDFNESLMFFDLHNNNTIDYDTLFVKFNLTNYFVSIK